MGVIVCQGVDGWGGGGGGRGLWVLFIWLQNLHNLKNGLCSEGQGIHIPVGELRALFFRVFLRVAHTQLAVFPNALQMSLLCSLICPGDPGPISHFKYLSLKHFHNNE